MNFAAKLKQISQAETTTELRSVIREYTDVGFGARLRDDKRWPKFAYQDIGLDCDPKQDAENAIKVHRFLLGAGVSKYDLTADKDLIAYLAHVTFRDYAIGRWLTPRIPQIERSRGQSLLKSLSRFRNIISWRFFHSKWPRNHAINRLWRAAYLTHGLPNQGPIYAQKTAADPYYYTRILASNPTSHQFIVQRKVTTHPKVLIPVLDAVDEYGLRHKTLTVVMREVDLVFKYRKLAVLPPEVVHRLINQIALDVGQRQLGADEAETPDDVDEIDLELASNR